MLLFIVRYKSKFHTHLIYIETRDIPQRCPWTVDEALDFVLPDTP